MIYQLFLWLYSHIQPGFKLKYYFFIFAEVLEYHVVPHTEYSAGLYSREFLRTIDRHHDRLTVHFDGGMTKFYMISYYRKKLYICSLRDITPIILQNNKNALLCILYMYIHEQIKWKNFCFGIRSKLWTSLT